jgi:hypothetical protein
MRSNLKGTGEGGNSRCSCYGHGFEGGRGWMMISNKPQGPCGKTETQTLQKISYLHLVTHSQKTAQCPPNAAPGVACMQAAVDMGHMA